MMIITIFPLTTDIEGMKHKTALYLVLPITKMTPLMTA